MTDLLTARLRTGRRNPQALYAQHGDEPSDADPSIGWGDPAAVATAVAAVNTGEPVHGTRWCWTGCDGGRALVYDRPSSDMYGGWVIAVSSPSIAARITAAANGPVPDA